MELIVVVVISAGIAENSLNGVSRSLNKFQVIEKKKKIPKQIFPKIKLFPRQKTIFFPK